jgi:hypothetical protein
MRKSRVQIVILVFLVILAFFQVAPLAASVAQPVLFERDLSNETSSAIQGLKSLFSGCSWQGACFLRCFFHSLMGIISALVSVSVIVRLIAISAGTRAIWTVRYFVLS